MKTFYASNYYMFQPSPSGAAIALVGANVAILH